MTRTIAAIGRRSMFARIFGVVGVCLAVFGMVFVSPATATDQRPTVATTSGPVTGVVEPGLEVFRGIPYAAPPVGELRFRPPAPTPTWTTPRDASSFGPACTQDPDHHEMVEGTPNSEDCLTLNVWTPSVSGKAPVMVFIHGGGFTAGSTRDPWYEGAALARRGVVLITPQYRVGPFGWLDLSALGPEYATSGNNGLQDQMAALRWVRANAAAFGGDPENVTVVGESAGSISVSAMLGSPAADGLFDRAILESGTAGTVATKPWSTRVFDRFVEYSHVSDPKEILTLPTNDVLDAARQIYETELSDTAFHPLVDQEILPDLPMHRLASASGPKVPVIIGTNLDEARYWLYYIPELDKLPLRYYEPWLTSLVGERADAVVAAYRGERPELDDSQIGLALSGDVGFRMPAIRMAEALSARGDPVWMYLTTVSSPDIDGRMGSAHAIELPFLFGTMQADRAPELVGTDPANAKLSDAMQELWVSFARDGAPSAANGLEWPQYDTTNRATLMLDHDISVVNNPYPAARTAWGEMRFDGSDPALDRLTALQYQGTNPNDPIVIATVIGWPWVIAGIVLLVATVIGVIVLARWLIRRRREAHT